MLAPVIQARASICCVLGPIAVEPYEALPVHIRQKIAELSVPQSVIDSGVRVASVETQENFPFKQLGRRLGPCSDLHVGTDGVVRPNYAAFNDSLFTHVVRSELNR